PLRRLRRGGRGRPSAHGAASPSTPRAGEGGGAAADRQGRAHGREGPCPLRGAAPLDVGGVRRRGGDREALPPPGRDRHAVGAHDRRADARRRDGDVARPRHARAGAHPDRRRDTSALGSPHGVMTWEAHDLGVRPLFVWAPVEGSRAYPTFYVLHAHMRSARWWFNVEPFVPSYPEVIDALAPEAIVVLVDGWTDAGGGQWIGEHAESLRADVVPFVDDAYPTSGLRGLQGKSSGGYG